MKKRNYLNKIKELLSKPFAYQHYHHPPDYVFIITLGLIIFFGLIMLSSASSVQGFQKFADSYWFFKHQLFKGLIPGLIAFYIASQIDYRVWKKHAFTMLLVSVGLLILVFIPGLGVSYGKTQSWLQFGPVGFQPTEIVKLTFLIYLATWLERRGERGLKDPQYGLLPFLFALGVISFLILAQPDTGSLMIIIAISLMVYFLAGAPLKHLLGIIIGGLLILFIAIQVTPYRLDRITAFFNPAADPQGIG
ncbi:MAG TPA: FtsW/RodA/SpoVE family cell cycle protein, partial [Patescibacteria group bacterium]|nr:FtsW/RodA/SpoVE family cell cycle protein [Patescibacteria group bacterium]